MLFGRNSLTKLFPSSLAVLAVALLVHCADYGTVPHHRHNAAIAFTNDGKPQRATLVRKLSFYPSELRAGGSMKFEEVATFVFYKEEDSYA